jgi:hypothetical protein
VAHKLQARGVALFAGPAPRTPGGTAPAPGGTRH